MEEMVGLFLPFFFFVSYICLRYTYWTNDWKTKMMKKRMRSSQNSRFFTIFAKNTAHNERRLLNFSYLCTVADNPSQTWHRKRLAFSKLRTSTTLKNNWKGKDVLPYVMIVVDTVHIRHTRVWAVPNSLFR